jgi:hypothetical protein
MMAFITVSQAKQSELLVGVKEDGGWYLSPSMPSEKADKICSELEEQNIPFRKIQRPQLTIEDILE